MLKVSPQPFSPYSGRAAYLHFTDITTGHRRVRGTRDNYHAEQEAKSAYSRTAPNQLVNAVVFLFYILLTVAIFVHTLLHVSKPSEGKKKYAVSSTLSLISEFAYQGMSLTYCIFSYCPYLSKSQAKIFTNK